jgi:hypothetical protein
MFGQKAQLAAELRTTSARVSTLAARLDNAERRVETVLALSEYAEANLAQIFPDGIQRCVNTGVTNVLTFTSLGIVNVNLAVELTTGTICVTDVDPGNYDRTTVKFDADGRLNTEAIWRIQEFCGKVFLLHNFKMPSVDEVNLTAAPAVAPTNVTHLDKAAADDEPYTA